MMSSTQPSRSRTNKGGQGEVKSVGHSHLLVADDDMLSIMTMIIAMMNTRGPAWDDDGVDDIAALHVYYPSDRRE